MEEKRKEAYETLKYYIENMCNEEQWYWGEEEIEKCLKAIDLLYGEKTE